MLIKILTLFPKMFDGFLSESIIKRAINKNICQFKIIDIRSYSHLKHNHVDDTPYGGGCGMVLRIDILHKAILDNITSDTKVILLSPCGKKYNQKKAYDLSKYKEIMLICGHYEGIDERIYNFIHEDISIGDFVLTGGEIASMCISDSIVRLLDGAINKNSHLEDSFNNNLLDYPKYTKPKEYLGYKVPDILLSGHHENIKKYRRDESLRITKLKRPDLLE